MPCPGSREVSGTCDEQMVDHLGNHRKRECPRNHQSQRDVPLPGVRHQLSVARTIARNVPRRSGRPGGGPAVDHGSVGPALVRRRSRRRPAPLGRAPPAGAVMAVQRVLLLGRRHHSGTAPSRCPARRTSRQHGPVESLGLSEQTINGTPCETVPASRHGHQQWGGIDDHIVRTARPTHRKRLRRPGTGVGQRSWAGTARRQSAVTRAGTGALQRLLQVRLAGQHRALKPRSPGIIRGKRPAWDAGSRRRRRPRWSRFRPAPAPG